MSKIRGTRRNFLLADDRRSIIAEIGDIRKGRSRRLISERQVGILSRPIVQITEEIWQVDFEVSRGIAWHWRFL